VRLDFDTSSMASYGDFLKLKQVPAYSWSGSTAVIPDEFADRFGRSADSGGYVNWEPSAYLFDYQRDIARLALKKRKFAVFAECGLGKTAILLEFAQAAQQSLGASRNVLIVSPLMVAKQTIDEAKRFYGDIQIEQVDAAGLGRWLKTGDGIGITNYEAIREGLERGNLGGLILDESSLLKSHYGAWGTRLIELGKGVDFKLALTGTPAPNDRVEFANHAVFLDRFRTVNEFMARYFVNRGQTQNRWEIKPHALKPFYRDMNDWCIFLSNPAIYGWKDNAETIPPINVHIEHVDLTEQQRKAVQEITGGLFAATIGGIGQRTKLSQVAKGNHGGDAVDTRKPEFIRTLIDSWPDESTIIWCRYNAEQDSMAALFPDAANITGATPYEERLQLIDDFKAGRRRVLISKPKILGFGLNLQIATRQVFSGLQDSYEEFWQAVKRSNRIGSTKPLNVHIPATEIEMPMIQTVIEKAHRIQHDTEQQQAMFKEHHCVAIATR
jgi:hypothetical protein